VRTDVAGELEEEAACRAPCRDIGRPQAVGGQPPQVRGAFQERLRT
jgi:hypothetical protein